MMGGDDIQVYPQCISSVNTFLLEWAWWDMFTKFIFHCFTNLGSMTFVVFTIEGFHMMSYQANFASHHTLDNHVGYLFAWDSIGKYNKCPITFYLDHYTQYQIMRNQDCCY